MFSWRFDQSRKYIRPRVRRKHLFQLEGESRAAAIINTAARAF